MSETEWSEPALYARGGQLIAPRTFTEADPMSMVLVPEWERAGTDDDLWGAVTYVGRPKTDRGQPEQRGRARRTAYQGRRRQADVKVAPSDETADAGSNQRLMANSRSMALASLTSRVTGFLRSILLVAAL